MQHISVKHHDSLDDSDWPLLRSPSEHGIIYFKNTQYQWEIDFDAVAFRPEEIKVSIRPHGHEHYLHIEGNHSARKDEYGSLSRQIHRDCPIPDDVNMETLSANVYPNARLRKITFEKYSDRLPAQMNLPDGFVYLKEFNTCIIPNLSYYSHDNFIGCRLPGYHANEIILTRQAAESLVHVQEWLTQDGYTLIVYDAYRPRKAADFIMEWLGDPYDIIQKPKFYPNFKKHDLYEMGYVTKLSSHSRGSTISVTIMTNPGKPKGHHWSLRKLLSGANIMFNDDGTLDMGTSYDFFDKASYHDSCMISKEILERRNYLRNIMKLYGFEENHKAWWQYTLKEEPFKNTYFNFNIESICKKN